MRTSRRLALLGATTALLISGTGIATADDISNSLDSSVDATAEVMPLNVGGAAGITTLAVSPANGDSKQGCNLTGSTTLKVSVSSDHPEVATVSPSPVTFTSCGDTHDLTVTPVAQGSATVSLTLLSNDSGGDFNLAPATFTVNVAAPAPANTAPSVTVGGVEPGASYDKGSVPTATCNVTDAEDGDSSFPATLSAVTGIDPADGIGSQTASCSYTDAGELNATSSVTYTIVDPSAPAIGYTLDPTSPDGENNWYRGDVTLTWTVDEPESPSSLSLSGCDPVTVSADQLSTDYTCSASSAGGSAGPATVTIKRDGNGPVVAYDQVVSGSQGDNGWYTSDVTVRFTASDDFSGVDADNASKEVTVGTEGDDVTVPSPAFSDIAGNPTAAGAVSSEALKIDQTAPHDVTFSGGPADGGSYYYGQVPAAPTCSALDEVSGASCVVTGDSDPNSVGSHAWTATATNGAGLVASESVTYTVLAWTDNGFYNPVNMGATLNTVKAGSTVPMKFNVSMGSTELTDTAVVKSFSTKPISCSSLLGDTTDPVEVTATGGTSLRYDSTGRQFVQNWKTPSTAGLCYQVTMTTQDGTALRANFKLK